MVLLKVDIIIFLMLFLFIFVKMGGIIIFFVLFLKKKIKNYKYYSKWWRYKECVYNVFCCCGCLYRNICRVLLCCDL